MNKFLEANHASQFPPMREGFWRPALELPPEATSGELVAGEEFQYWKHNDVWKLPFPVVYEPEGYDKNLFLILLKEMEESPFTEKQGYRGFSLHRLTGKPNGGQEYERDGWRWPSGYRSYIEMGVPPSRDFYRFITTEDCPTLPTYTPIKVNHDEG